MEMDNPFSTRVSIVWIVHVCYVYGGGRDLDHVVVVTSKWIVLVCSVHGGGGGRDLEMDRVGVFCLRWWSLPRNATVVVS
eukprot:1362311-Amorphochlora_amoeboformis.AAC.4